MPLPTSDRSVERTLACEARNASSTLAPRTIFSKAEVDARLRSLWRAAVQKELPRLLFRASSSNGKDYRLRTDQWAFESSRGHHPRFDQRRGRHGPNVERSVRVRQRGPCSRGAMESIRRFYRQDASSSLAASSNPVGRPAPQASLYLVAPDERLDPRAARGAGTTERIARVGIALAC